MIELTDWKSVLVGLRRVELLSTSEQDYAKVPLPVKAVKNQNKTESRVMNLMARYPEGLVIS